MSPLRSLVRCCSPRSPVRVSLCSIGIVGDAFSLLFLAGQGLLTLAWVLVLELLRLLLLRLCLVIQLLLFGHGAHATHVFGLFVDLLHVVARSQHLVLAHSALTTLATAHALLSFPFAFFGTSFVECSIELYIE